MKIGLQIPDFTTPGGPARLGADLATVARTADDAGFSCLAVMDHFFQIGVIGPPEREMLEAYTTLGYLAAHTSRARLLTLVTGVDLPASRASSPRSSPPWTCCPAAGPGSASARPGTRRSPAGWASRSRRWPSGSSGWRRRCRSACRCSAATTALPGRHYQLERPLNSPPPLSQPHPPILIGGSGEKKTLRLVARYAQACNLFPGPDLARKLDVLRGHCEAEGRDYDEIEKTVYFLYDVGPKGEKAQEVVDALGGLAQMGFQTAIGGVANVWDITPLEVIGSDVIPAVANL